MHVKEKQLAVRLLRKVHSCKNALVQLPAKIPLAKSFYAHKVKVIVLCDVSVGLMWNPSCNFGVVAAVILFPSS